MVGITDAEKNLLFVGIFLFSLMVVLGLGLAETGLSRLMPDMPVQTINLGYTHGFYISGKNIDIHLPTLSLGRVSVEGGQANVMFGNKGISVPWIVELGGIENIRDGLEKLTK